MPGAPGEVSPAAPVRVFVEPFAKFRVSLPPEDKSMAGCPSGAAMLTPFSVMVAAAFAFTTILSLVGVVALAAMEMVMFAPFWTVSTLFA